MLWRSHGCRNTLSAPSQRKLIGWTSLFLAYYLGASFLDLWTTELGLLDPAAREGNIAATTNGTYNASKAWLITVGGGFVLSYMFVFALRKAHSIPDHWLEQPITALLRLSILPWLDRDTGRAALNSMSYALAFPLLRLAAAANNAMSAQGAEGFLSYAVLRTARLMPVLLATVVVVLLGYLFLTMLAAPLAARIIKRAHLRFAGDANHQLIKTPANHQPIIIALEAPKP